MKIVIIGNGIGGITAARNIRKQSDHEILVISAESDYFFSRTALMYVYMGQMKFEHTQPYENWFWEKNRISLLNAYVKSVDFEKQTLHTANGQKISYDKLIIATGSVPKKIGLSGEGLKGVQSLYSKQDLELLEQNSGDVKEAVIVGGGLIGIELAEMLRSRNIKVSILSRENAYWNSVLPQEEAQMISRHIAEHHINLIANTELGKILDDGSGSVKGIITKKGAEIPCQLLLISIGVQPNINFLKNSALAINKGVLVNEFLETNITNVYALGDCAEFENPKLLHPPIEQLWYTAQMQGEALANTICGHRQTYRRGVWFNSAKFLDIEYQTYGCMFKQPLADEETFYWEHSSGRKAFRANFEKESGALRGFNFLGIRFNHPVANRWISEKRNIGLCIAELKKGVFDAEFSKQHHRKIADEFFRQFPAYAKTQKTNKLKFWM
ncbi:NADH dehydrogenase [Pelobium manganitolerans]|uniref:NADH dehydrogenase n=1 Tax=Pelobium manganitolerans TaxID=1842495 RepID=A0A419S648_9SPHI|nr:FAD/NAD(P)-binding oxidoreductase [Pelobium manganitolerans]RKD16328.1 NADH dehydrogenase [Pelobium manganitolerans]